MPLPLIYIVKVAEMNESAPGWGYWALCFPAFHGDETQSTRLGSKLDLRLCSTAS